MACRLHCFAVMRTELSRGASAAFRLAGVFLGGGLSLLAAGCSFEGFGNLGEELGVALGCGVGQSLGAALGGAGDPARHGEENEAWLVVDCSESSFLFRAEWCDAQTSPLMRGAALEGQLALIHERDAATEISVEVATPDSLTADLAPEGVRGCNGVQHDIELEGRAQGDSDLVVRIDDGEVDRFRWQVREAASLVLQRPEALASPIPLNWPAPVVVEVHDAEDETMYAGTAIRWEVEDPSVVAFSVFDEDADDFVDATTATGHLVWLSPQIEGGTTTLRARAGELVLEIPVEIGPPLELADSDAGT